MESGGRFRVFELLISWPVVACLFSAMLVLTFLQISKGTDSHDGALFTLASNLALSFTFLMAPIFERFNKEVFVGKVAFYRFCIGGASLLTIAFWFVLRAYPIQIWNVNRDHLILFYGALLFGSLAFAYLIATFSPKKGTKDGTITKSEDGA